MIEKIPPHTLYRGKSMEEEQNNIPESFTILNNKLDEIIDILNKKNL